MKHLKILAAVFALLLLVACGEGEKQDLPETEPETKVETEAPKPIPEALTGHKIDLRFDENGEFRILVLSDVQADPPYPTEYTLNAIARVVEREKPDLVLFGGDNSTGVYTEEELRIYVEAVTRYLEENQIPWAHVYGNHDQDGGLSKEVQQEIYQSFEHCVAQAGPAEIHGVGNYVLPVYSSDTTKTDPIFAVWGMDSGRYVQDEGYIGLEDLPGYLMFRGNPTSTYAYMPFSQVEWYYDTSVAIEEYAGHKVPGLMLMHIPPQEFYEVSMNRYEEEVHFTGAGGGVSAAPLNSGIFSAMIERGDVKAVVCGHDHSNYFTGDYGGIKLCYSSCISYDTFCNPDVNGGRVFVIHEDDPARFDTYMAYVYGVNLAEIPRAQILKVDFESEGKYTFDSETAEIVEGSGQDGSAGLCVNGECFIAFEHPYSLDDSRFVKLWVNVPEDSSLIELQVESILGLYTADLTSASVSILPDGETKWSKIASGTPFPSGYKGWIAVSIGGFMLNENTRLAFDSDIMGYGIRSEGAVVVDGINSVPRYNR